MSKSEREKVGFEQRLDLGLIESVARPGAAIGHVVGSMIERLLAEGVELDTLNVIVSPECTDEGEVVAADEHGFEPTPDVLLVRAWAERDRRA